MSSVRKGADAERELVRILTEAGHVAHRKNRTGWMVTMYLDDFLTLAAPAKPSPEPLEPFF